MHPFGALNFGNFLAFNSIYDGIATTLFSGDVRSPHTSRGGCKAILCRIYVKLVCPVKKKNSLRVRKSLLLIVTPESRAHKKT